MKKLLIIALLVTFGISFGQVKEDNSNIQKGTWNLGGNFTLNNSIYNSSNTENNQFYIGFYPRVGYDINNNLIVGMGIGYEYHNNKNYYSETESNNSNLNRIVVFPYIKKYFNINEKFSFHLQGEFRLSKSWNDNNNNNNNSINFNSYEVYNSSLFVGIRPGITFFLTKKLALETNIGALGYSTGKNESDNREGKFNSFNFNFNSNNLLLGLSYYF